jgi:hypothetical protein
LKIRSTESTCAGGQAATARRCVGPAPVGVVVPSEPRSHWQMWQASAAKPLSRRSSRTTLGDDDPSVVHDGGVPHGNSDDPLVRAQVLLRPPGKALPHHGRCELHDLSQHVVLHTKLETHVIMKSHMNVICLQYRSLPLCRQSSLGAPGTSRPAGLCRGPGQVAVAG